MELLFALDVFSIKLGLERMQRLLALTQNPQHELQYIHIAGTNGKGSVAAMLDAAFQAAGYRTGLYTSPHLIDVRERIRISGELISQSDFAAIVSEIYPLIDELECTFFEALTAVALIHFSRSRVEMAILEVGLGGRLDATNVIEPKVAVITTIDFDHVEHLGHSLTEIAREKAGIIKQGVPCVTGNLPDEAERVIVEQCAVLGCRLYRTKAWSKTLKRSQDVSGSSFELALNNEKHYFELALPGAHQIDNAMTAAMTLTALQESGITIDLNALKIGLKNIQWPGRFQIVTAQPLIVADVAHNIESMTQLYYMLRDFYSDREIVLILGVMQDKDYKAMIRIIAPLVDLFIPVQAQNKRALSGQALFQEIKGQHMPAIPGGSVKDGLLSALSRCTENTVICITGSHYVVGEAINEINHLTKKNKINNFM